MLISCPQNGLLSSLPYLGKYLCALASSVLADFLRRSGKLSTTAARKLFTGFAVGLPGTIFGMANTLSSFGGWLSTFMVGELTKENIVFYILAGTYITGALCFVTFGSGELQPWNSAKPTNEVEKPHEEQPLNEEKA
ncbi:hypothetical protein HF086_011514 [Spodoptera exigua]|uniref:Uncharacterized protein n=1 Tax=Spodoptera exigua TaxID=7107 RepID=A0A922MD57_SPOEX|nr:hypothetical protein HF086_011514 [Spodoptera exigua]